MAETSCHGLVEFGLPLISKDDPSFATLVSDILRLPGPGPAPPTLGSEQAAVLLNKTGKAIVAVEWFWRYTSRDGSMRTSRFSNLGSSAQRDVLKGRSKVGRDLGTFILSGSKRLITEHGLFGNNLDVLTSEELPRVQGYCGGWGGGNSSQSNETEQATVELVLDLVILENGLCLGPNESALYEAINESLDIQQKAAQEAATALQSGAAVGRVFEIIRPLARQHRHSRAALPSFGNEAIHHLINANDTDLLAVLKSAAEPRSLALRRA